MPNDYGQQFGGMAPQMMLRVNGSSLGGFKTCPRKFELEAIGRWAAAGERVHLTFGSLFHKGVEDYEHLRAADISHNVAVHEVFRRLSVATWNEKLGRPWMSGHPEKNRTSLLRSIVWYLDHWYGGAEDELQYETFRFANGAPAVELEFEVDSGFRTKFGEVVSFVGRLDRVVRAKFNGRLYILDTKTTSFGTGAAYYSKFTPDNQFSLYPWVGQAIFAEPIAGMILDQVQVGAGFTRFARGIVERSEAQLAEWIRDAHWWLQQLEHCAEDGRWPQNDRSCGLYGGCEFRGVCAEEPALREQILRMRYVREPTRTEREEAKQDASGEA